MVDGPARPALNLDQLRSLRSESEDGWRSIDVVDTTGSTNADLLARAERGLDVRGAVLAAEFQSAGRGRQGRSWTAPARSQLSVSFGVDAQGVPPARWGLLPLAAGVSVVRAVADCTGIEVGLKWPNDVLADGAKLAGLLAEVSPTGAVIVLGLGLNVSLTEAELPGVGATSLLRLGARQLNRTVLLSAVLRRLADGVAQWRRSDDSLVDAYRRVSVTVGRRVRAELPGDRRVIGTATAIDAEGRLVIDGDGTSVAVAAGDVVHLRPAADRGDGSPS